MDLNLVHNIDIDADADTAIEVNPIPPSRSRSKDAACIKAVSLMLPLSINIVNQALVIPKSHSFEHDTTNTTNKQSLLAKWLLIEIFS